MSYHFRKYESAKSTNFTPSIDYSFTVTNDFSYSIELKLDLPLHELTGLSLRAYYDQGGYFRQISAEKTPDRYPFEANFGASISKCWFDR